MRYLETWFGDKPKEILKLCVQEILNIGCVSQNVYVRENWRIRHFANISRWFKKNLRKTSFILQPCRNWYEVMSY
jgi:hypothetical protein